MGVWITPDYTVVNAWVEGRQKYRDKWENKLEFKK